ncbi:MAG: tetratricopeptide repeat protein, partial [Candidatus Riflebacteria bacterium]|nr:tetratricopeptide repeat protein [Candidatus Riflebacteria bacterium]
MMTEPRARHFLIPVSLAIIVLVTARGPMTAARPSPRPAGQVQGATGSQRPLEPSLASLALPAATFEPRTPPRPVLLSVPGRLPQEEPAAVLVGADRSRDGSSAEAAGRTTILARGRQLESQGRLEEAHSCFEKAALSYPDDPEILCRLAKVSLYL